MQITGYFFGKKSAISEAEKSLMKRINHDITLKLMPLNHSTKSRAEECKTEEEKTLLSRLNKGETLLALDGNGKDVTSEEFAKLMQKFREQKGRFSFVIGGSCGLSDQVLSRADYSVSFGKMTWTHDTARFLMLEQIYRAVQIKKGTKYHK